MKKIYQIILEKITYAGDRNLRMIEEPNFELYHFRPNEKYVFLGYSNGVLRLHKIISPKIDPKIKKPFFNWTLEDYWHIDLHDPSNGAIREIFPIDTIKGHLILTCAQDGSLLVHEIGKALWFR